VIQQEAQSQRPALLNRDDDFIQHAAEGYVRRGRESGMIQHWFEARKAVLGELEWIQAPQGC